MDTVGFTSPADRGRTESIPGVVGDAEAETCTLAIHSGTRGVWIVMKCGDNWGYIVVSLIRYIPFLLLFPSFRLSYN